MYAIGDIVRLKVSTWPNGTIQHDVECVITHHWLREEYPYTVKSIDLTLPILETKLMNVYSCSTKEEGIIYVRSK